jgi:hypothetical protein
MRRLVLVLVALAVAACGGGTPEPSGPAPEIAAPPAQAALPSSPGGAAELGGAPAVLPEPNRPLTAGERALLRPLFRDGVDYDGVRVIAAAFPFQPGDTYMTPNGHIYAPGWLYREDFSRDPEDRAVLVHEIAHVWQFANGMNLVAHAIADFARHRGDYGQAYAYRLAPGRDLADYGVEQQASILEDYYLVTVRGERPRQLENRGLSARERRALFGGVLRRFFADARYARGASGGASGPASAHSRR